ncbi:hypothetical protein KBY58_02830 [Cyanobium sp. HWJ4-Hawea]|uniref:hypothetical protein n=1 Tax=Cyanobium sp. HWJ4-Hawea TaxID=2823713 RepID=UPI0020CCC14A|nr:hypothetical protein [Cyanobium sp. HWJ4-Hawea]MCP9808366.1 hypothetical protein [Cyanobium sp. HWJ4-Hawea]
MTFPQIPNKDSAEWAAWAKAHPLHKAVVGPRATKPVLEMRTQQVLEWIGLCRTRPAMLLLVSEYWGVTERAFEDHHAEAVRRLRARFDQDRPDYLSQKLEQIEHLMQVSLDAGQLSAAVGSMSLLLKATGCDQPSKRTK